MMKGLTAAFFVSALPFVAAAQADDLRGQWQVVAPAYPAYVGMILIDAEHRVTWDSPDNNGRPVNFRGYVARLDATKVDIALTDRVVVVHTHCTIQSSDLLHCSHLFSNGTGSGLFMLTRIGPGPKNLIPALP